MAALSDLEYSPESEAEESPDSDGRRVNSAIQFPYGDLNDAVEVAKTMYANAGSSGGTWEQIASWLGYASANNGAFRNKIATARIFGVTETKSGGAILTVLGVHLADATRERAARVTAFLNVPLYRVIYEEHRGMTLPPDVGLEQEMAVLGVSPKQKERARQIFQRSADQAGFFAYGRNKLVMPVMEVLNARSPLAYPHEELLRTADAAQSHNGSHGATSGQSQHPLIAGLMHSLPEPGKPWAKEKRQQWLTTAEHVLALIYPEE